MHHYQHNIKTFNHATRHLTRVERALYRDLIELYYDTEQPLPAVSFDKLCRLVLAHSDDEKAALKAVLDEFFVLTGEVYSHDYCDTQIEKYRTNSSVKAKAGKASAQARKAKSEQRKAQRKHTLNMCSTDVQLTSNQEPVTNNQKPINKVKEKTSSDKSDVALINKNPVMDADYLVNAFAVEKQIALDWLAVRKHKKASPLSETAIKLLINESAKAGITPAQAIAQAAGSGWISFKASYCDLGMQPTKAAFAAGDGKW